MQDEIRKIIESQLPAEVGGILKQRLEEAEADRRDLAIRTEERDKAKTELVNLQGLNLQNTNLGVREEAVLVRERDVAVREQLVELREAHAKERVGVAEGLVRDVFGNRQITRVQVLDVNGYNFPDAQGNTYGPQPSVTGSMTTTEDEA